MHLTDVSARFRFPLFFTLTILYMLNIYDRDGFRHSKFGHVQLAFQVISDMQFFHTILDLHEKGNHVDMSFRKNSEVQVEFYKWKFKFHEYECFVSCTSSHVLYLIHKIMHVENQII